MYNIVKFYWNTATLIHLNVVLGRAPWVTLMHSKFDEQRNE